MSKVTTRFPETIDKLKGAEVGDRHVSLFKIVFKCFLKVYLA
jgi:hypothetical protein